MKNRSRTAAKVAGVVAAGALVFGVMGPAVAAPVEVSYRLDVGTITFPTAGTPEVIELPAATGIVGTWDDATGAFSGTFSSADVTSTEPAPAPAPAGSTITRRTQLTAPNPVTGTIDPATGIGSVGATFNVRIVLESLQPAGDPPPAPLALGFECTIANIAVTYNVVATKVPADSLNYTNLALTAPAFTVPAATCIIIATGAAAPAAITDGINGLLVLPNAGVTSSITMLAGPVPPPPSTTTTTIPPTTTTTAAPAEEEEAEAADAVVAQARFTG